MGLKAAIFDLDGVVVDTVPIHFKAWKQMFEEYGKTFTFDDYKEKVDGIPRRDGARAILTDLTDEELKKASDLKQAYFVENLEKEEIPQFTTTIDLITAFLNDGIKCAVVSSSKNCPTILKRIGLFDKLGSVISGDDITRGKPDPQIFLMAAQQLGADPSECIAFEDAVLGVESAKNAKMHCIGIDRYGCPERLSLADIVVSDLGEVNLAGIKELF
jgi:beta-phosphoglucomutase